MGGKQRPAAEMLEDELGDGPRDRQTVVGSGAATHLVHDDEAVVDPVEGEPLPPGACGEVCRADASEEPEEAVASDGSAEEGVAPEEVAEEQKIEEATDEKG